MTENKKENGWITKFLLLIYNLLVICAFIGLAYLFGHWWISLFALLFLFQEKTTDDKDVDNKDDNKSCDTGHLRL